MSISPSNTTSLTVSGMSCSHCIAAVTGELSKLERVTRVQIDLPTGLVTVESDQPVDLATITAAIEQAGYTVASGPEALDGFRRRSTPLPHDGRAIAEGSFPPSGKDPSACSHSHG